MDTVDYYNKYAIEYYEKTVDIDMEEIAQKFLKLIPSDGAILDLGCGSGRDSLYFVNEGYDVTSVDGSKELCELAEIHIGQDVFNKRFDELEFEEVFDGVWACASLLHVPSSNIDCILDKVERSLIPGGVLYMSFKHGEFEGIRDGRYYVDYTTLGIKELIKRHSRLEIVEIFKTKRDMCSDKKSWINVFVRKDN